MSLGSRIWLVIVALGLAGCADPDADLVVEPGAVDEDEADEGGGKADAASGRVEVKVTIDAASIKRARTRLGLTSSAAQARRVWFYDTPALAGFDAGLILRARDIRGAPDDSTVKLRPLVADALSRAERELPGMKCEIDRTPSATVSSCSLTVRQGEDEIAAVGAGTRAIDKLFSADQERLVAAHGPVVAWNRLVALGPVPTSVWSLTTAELPSKLTAELWVLPDGSELLELSVKVPMGRDDAALDDLRRFLATRNLALATDQVTKTRRALELLADY